MDVSILVCTYNRAESLRRMFESFLTLRIPAGVSWQVVVNDNASVDRTMEVIEEYRDRLPLVAGYEARQGKSYALNSGLDLCEGRYVFLTDDDVQADPGWVESTLQTFREERVDAVCGKILPRWPTGPPPWYSSRLDPALAILDYGRKPFDLEPKDGGFFGANVAILRETIDRLGRWSTTLNRAGSGLLMGEDSDMCDRILRAGGRVRYDPGSIVYHCFDRRRTRIRYFRRWFIAHGQSAVLRGVLFPDEGPKFFGIPRYLYRQAAGFLAGSVWRWLFCSRAVAFAHETKFWAVVGAMVLYHRGLQAPEARPSSAHRQATEDPRR